MVIKNVALIGLGAIGSVYAKYLYESNQIDFAVIAGGVRARKIEEKGVIVNDSVFYPKVVVPEEKRWKADLIIICVKNEQLEQALIDMRNYVTESTILLSMLSGINAVKKIGETYPDSVTISGMNLGMDVAREGTKIVNNSMGTLKLGGQADEFIDTQIEAVKQCLVDAGIVSEVLADVNTQMWKKWLANVGVNQVASILGLKYGQIRKVEYAMQLMRDVMNEAIKVTSVINNSGTLKIELTEDDIEEAINSVDYYPIFAKPSVLQDLQSKRKTEVGSFSGILIALADRLEIPVPSNKFVFNEIKAMEEMYNLDKIV